MLGLGYLGLHWLAMQTGLIKPAVRIGNRPLLAYSIAASLLGGQALSLSLLAELIVANTARTAECYGIRETIEKGNGSTA